MFQQKGGGNSSIELDPIYTYLSIVDRFADGDITKYEEIQEREYLECLSILTYWTARDDKLKKEQALADARNK